jgi:hypothetical protein
VGLALQGHRRWFAGPGDGAAPPGPGRDTYRLAPGEANRPWPGADGRTLAGLRRLDSDPCGLAPPPGAERLSVMVLPGGATVGRYLAPVPAEAVEAHYRELLAAAGYEPLPAETESDRRVYHGPPGQAVLRLQPAAGNPRMTRVVLTLFSLDGDAPRRQGQR